MHCTAAASASTWRFPATCTCWTAASWQLTSPSQVSNANLTPQLHVAPCNCTYLAHHELGREINIVVVNIFIIVIVIIMIN